MPPTTTLKRTCPFCRKEHTMTFDSKVLFSGLEKWDSGMKIQDALPTCTPEQREFLLTGICSSCWKKM